MPLTYSLTHYLLIYLPVQVLRVGGSELSKHLRLLHHEHSQKIPICSHWVHV